MQKTNYKWNGNIYVSGALLFGASDNGRSDYNYLLSVVCQVFDYE